MASATCAGATCDGAVEVGDRAGDAEDLAVGPRGEGQALTAAASRRVPRRTERATRSTSRDERRRVGGVAVTPRPGARAALHARAASTRARTEARRLARGAALQRRDLDRREHDVHVDAVEQRPAQLRAVARGPVSGEQAQRRGAVAQRSRTAQGFIAQTSERPRREGGLGVRARDGDDAVFEGLPERLEGAATELRELVEKEHAVVGQAHLARPRGVASADEPDLAHRVVRGAEGPRAGEASRRR